MMSTLVVLISFGEVNPFLNGQFNFWPWLQPIGTKELTG
jgi:hypothetical protein